MNHCLSKVLLSVEFLWLVQVLHPKAGVVQCTGSCLLWELVVEGSNMILLIFLFSLTALKQHPVLCSSQIPAEPHNLLL